MMTEQYEVTRDDLPEELRGLLDHEAVEKIIEYQSQLADFSVILTESGRTQNVRVFYLENLRFEWAWVENYEDTFVLLKRREGPHEM